MIIGSVSAAEITSSNFKKTIEDTSSGKTVTLKSGTEYSLNPDNVNITINKTITIKSSSSSKNAIINLNGNGRAFEVRNGGDLTLINITLKNGNAYEGGAIYNYAGSVTLTGCTFTNNTATNGGAIFGFGDENEDVGKIIKATFTVKSCTFTNNIATGDGGAIYNLEFSILTVKSSTFTKNIATRSGGAIYNDFSDITLTGCTFTKNKAGDDGGAIYNIGSSTILIACIFRENTAYNGAAIYNGEYNKLNAKNCTFTKNTAKYGDYGGAIYKFKDSKLTLTGCTFDTTKKPDLKITKITRKGNYRYVFVKNIGKKSAGKNTLGVYIGKRLIKEVTVKGIAIGKTHKVRVFIPKKFRTGVKTFKVDIKNVVKESNEKNNSFKAK